MKAGGDGSGCCCRFNLFQRVFFLLFHLVFADCCIDLRSLRRQTPCVLHPLTPIPTCKWKPISLPVTLFTDTTHTKYYSLCCIRILCPVSHCVCMYAAAASLLLFSCSLLFARICFHACVIRQSIDSISLSLPILQGMRGCSLSSPIELPAKKLNKVHSVCTRISPLLLPALPSAPLALFSHSHRHSLPPHSIPAATAT